jgi:hypothetical protein
MGSFIRTKSAFPLKLSPALWKLLVEEPITLEDIGGYDKICMQSLETIQNLEREGIDEDSFHEIIDFGFVTSSVDGRTVELIPNGENHKVRYFKLKYSK